LYFDNKKKVDTLIPIDTGNILYNTDKTSRFLHIWSTRVYILSSFIYNLTSDSELSDIVAVAINKIFKVHDTFTGFPICRINRYFLVLEQFESRWTILIIKGWLTLIIRTVGRILKEREVSMTAIDTHKLKIQFKHIEHDYYNKNYSIYSVFLLTIVVLHRWQNKDYSWQNS